MWLLQNGGTPVHGTVCSPGTIHRLLSEKSLISSRCVSCGWRDGLSHVGCSVHTGCDGWRTLRCADCTNAIQHCVAVTRPGRGSEPGWALTWHPDQSVDDVGVTVATERSRRLTVLQYAASLVAPSLWGPRVTHSRHVLDYVPTKGNNLDSARHSSADWHTTRTTQVPSLKYSVVDGEWHAAIGDISNTCRETHTGVWSHASDGRTIACACVPPVNSWNGMWCQSNRQVRSSVYQIISMHPRTDPWCTLQVTDKVAVWLLP